MINLRNYKKKKKMDALSCRSSENPNETYWKSFKHAKLSEKKGCPNIHKGLVDLTSQVQLMSESLTSCQMQSKHRHLRKEYHSSNKGHRKWGNSSSVERLAEDASLKRRSRGRIEDIFVNYMIKDKDFLRPGKSKPFTSREEMLLKRYSNESVYSERLESYQSGSNTSREVPSTGSKVWMYDYREVDSGKMIELLVRELKTLAKLAPSVVVIVSTLAENFAHCQECRRCHEKISPSLPWILNRIQKLIKYVTTKRQETYIWPNDFSYLQLNVSKLSLEEEKNSLSNDHLSSSRATLTPVTPPRLLGKLEKVDPAAVSEDNPGVQLLLEVKPELEKKKFFYPAKPAEQSGWECQASFPVVRLREHASATVVNVLKPTSTPRINWEEKRQVALFKGFGVSVPVVYFRNPRTPASVTVSLAEAKLIAYDHVTPKIFIRPVLTSSERVWSPSRSLLNALIEKREWNIGQLPYSICKPNEKGKQQGRNKENPPEIVQNSSTETEEEEEEEEDMQVQRVNELEEEVKELKDLMLEVHKNQTELGKLLLEKKVFSQLMVKLTDPKMLDEENKTLKKASKIKAPSTSTSTVALQTKVDSLKRKCALKNRLIMTLLKGLRSNVPKELWEEVTAYAFDESESVDELDSEKVNEFIRQTSVFLTNEDKEGKVAPPPSQDERRSSEEEPKVKGIVGAEVEDSLKNLSCYKNQAPAELKGVSSRLEGIPTNIWAFPVLNAPNSMETTLRKLENQISILNTENERLWHQVKELREILKNSIKEMGVLESDQKVSMVRSPGKTINLVIQITEKDTRRSREGGVPRSEVEIIDERAKSSPIVRMATSESVTAIHEAERDNSLEESDRKLAVFAAMHDNKPRLKSDRRRSENDLNYVDDVILSVHDYKPENEKLRAVLREKMHANNHAHLPRTPHPSAHEMYQNFKPVVWVPSKYVIPEVSDTYGAGPSRKPLEMTNLHQKPSLMELAEIHCAGMYATMSNERELQTIPENDPDSPSPPSQGVSQALHRLRTRVRSLHKDMTVLKSKNDRIDKLLDKLMDDVVVNNHNYEDLQSSLNSLKSRLE